MKSRIFGFDVWSNLRGGVCSARDGLYVIYRFFGIFFLLEAYEIDGIGNLSF